MALELSCIIPARFIKIPTVFLQGIKLPFFLQSSRYLMVASEAHDGSTREKEQKQGFADR
jgi:hypothetical protein